MTKNQEKKTKKKRKTKLESHQENLNMRDYLFEFFLHVLVKDGDLTDHVQPIKQKERGAFVLTMFLEFP